MQESGKSARFFLSANTPQGFLSCFDCLYSVRDGWKAYILEGAPGTGKSEMLKKTGNALEHAGIKVEYIFSVLDSHTLDAVAFPELRVCVLDGAPPRSINSAYPGISEHIINLGEYWDEEKLNTFRDKIILFTSRIESSTDRAYRFLAAAASLLNDTCRLALECTDEIKLENYAAHLAKREFASKGRQGVEHRRFLTAITPDGVTSLCDEVANTYDRVCVIEDEFGLGRLFLNHLKNSALASGYDVISCSCPMFPSGMPEHLLIPSLSLAYLTSDAYHPIDGEGFRHIHMRRFLDRESIRLKRPRISFNRKAAHELIDESVLLLKDARTSYDMIKSCYSQAMDYTAVDKKADDLIEKLLTLKV